MLIHRRGKDNYSTSWEKGALRHVLLNYFRNVQLAQQEAKGINTNKL